MDQDYAKAFRIIRAAFGLKQSELAARMSISVSQLSLIEAGKRNATDNVIASLTKATRLPVELVELLASGQHAVGRGRKAAELGAVLLKLLAPNEEAEPVTSRKAR
jgi:transcriptional regulator with XRE-family HTH domain